MQDTVYLGTIVLEGPKFRGGTTHLKRHMYHDHVVPHLTEGGVFDDFSAALDLVEEINHMSHGMSGYPIYPVAMAYHGSRVREVRFAVGDNISDGLDRTYDFNDSHPVIMGWGEWCTQNRARTVMTDLESWTERKELALMLYQVITGRSAF
jgi:hypothetical protein